jgi:hypothetical protein
VRPKSARQRSAKDYAETTKLSERAVSSPRHSPCCDPYSSCSGQDSSYRQGGMHKCPCCLLRTTEDFQQILERSKPAGTPAR